MTYCTKTASIVFNRNGDRKFVLFSLNRRKAFNSSIIKHLAIDLFCKYLRSRSLVDDDVDWVGVCFGKVDKELSGDFVLMSS